MDSGALNKALLSVTRRTLIIEDDCNTKKFIVEDTNSKDALDRFLAVNMPGIAKRNDLVNSSILLKLKAAHIRTIKVRSPLICESSNGLCRYCYGLMPNGELPSIGENVGVQEGQALTERSTQLTMQTFHTGGTALGGGGIVGSFPRLEQLLEVPETLSNKASLASARGTVDSVTRNAIGGYEIEIDGKIYTIPPEHKVIVSKGDVIARGQPISSGNIQPKELGKLTTHLNAQQYIVNELNKIYKDDFNKKSFETVIRAISDNAQVTDAPPRSGYYRGDKSSISELDAINKKRVHEGLDPIKYIPYFTSIEHGNVYQGDWLTRFTTNRIKNAVQEGVARGSYANLHGKDPIPAYLYGDEFGKMNASRGEFY
jgi:DNA-directed RNA polymerase subunit beta'